MHADLLKAQLSSQALVSLTLVVDGDITTRN